MNARRELINHCLFVFAASSLAACATVGETDLRQGVLVRTDPPGATVFVDGAAVARAPAYVAIRRGRAPTVEVATAAGRQTAKIETGYRWGRSFLGNACLVAGAPYGWAIDFATGAAWDAKDPAPISVRLSKADREAAARTPLAAIAPPKSDFLALSDDAGDQIQSALARSRARPREGLLAYRTTLSVFLGNGWDFDGAPSDPRTPYARLGVRYVYESDVETHGDAVELKVRRVDVVNGASDPPFSIEMSAVDDWAKWYSERRWWANAIPNSLGVDFISERLDVSASGGRTYALDRAPAPQWWEQGLQYVSAIELSSTPPRRAGRALRWTLDLVPSVLFSRLAVRAGDMPAPPGGSPNETYLRLRIGAGYGAEGGLQLGRHYLYADLIPIVAWNQITWEESGKQRSTTIVGALLRFELGYSIFATSHLQFRLFTRAQTEDTSSWADALRDRLPPGDAAGIQAQQTTAGLAVLYRFEPTFERAARTDGR